MSVSGRALHYASICTWKPSVNLAHIHLACSALHPLPARQECLLAAKTILLFDIRPRRLRPGTRSTTVMSFVAARRPCLFYLVSPSQNIPLLAFCAPPDCEKLLRVMSFALYLMGPQPYGIPRFPIAGHDQRFSWLLATPVVFPQLCLNLALVMLASCSQKLTRAPYS